VYSFSSGSSPSTSLLKPLPSPKYFSNKASILPSKYNLSIISSTLSRRSPSALRKATPYSSTSPIVPSNTLYSPAYLESTSSTYVASATNASA